MLALVLFPVGEKTLHELGHLTEQHCDVKEKHYCAVEHTCDICDYVFSSQAVPPEKVSEQHLWIECTESFSEALVFNTLTSTKYTFTLRGPPAC
jgi:hypothetical protein